jgi:signal transducing adaptor molecule
VKNSGKLFHVEVASREFENDFMKLMSKAHHNVSKRLREALKRWAENEFKSDQQLNLIPSLYNKLKSSGIDFSAAEMVTTDNPSLKVLSVPLQPVKKSTPVSKDPNVVETQEEENQILKAIELSLKETTASPRSASAGASLYPSTNLSATNASANSTPVKEPKKVRALYDFEAAEDNELTFRSGEISEDLKESRRDEFLIFFSSFCDRRFRPELVEGQQSEGGGSVSVEFRHKGLGS